MAEGVTTNQDNVVCRFFLSSSCRDGDRCQFSHDRTRNVPDSVCRFYLQGRCFFGDHCRYDHVKVKNVANSKNNARHDKQSPGPSTMRSDQREPFHSVKQNANRNDAYQAKFSNLHKNTVNKEAPNVFSAGPGSSNWVNAPEFVPKTTRSYADTLKYSGIGIGRRIIDSGYRKVPRFELCPYYMAGDCPDIHCDFIHGDLCDLCDRNCLHPNDSLQRKAHKELCEKEIEEDMELSFAVQRSIGKTCGICMDVIMEKDPKSERRFGILEKCNHIFCLPCIRKWRQTKQYEATQNLENILDPVVTRACPECRVSSDFVTPSLYWFDTEEEKGKLIKNYKEAMSQKPCKYFKQGEGECPFGGACFYLHAKPDGTKVELPPPTRRRRQNQDGELDYMSRVFLWDYLEFREENIFIGVDMDDFEYSSESEDGSSDVSGNFFLGDSFLS